MIGRISGMACLAAMLCALVVPMAAYAAPLPAPAAPNAPANLALTAQQVTVSTPEGQDLAGMRVETGGTDLFTVLCQNWDTQPSANALGTTGAQWFYSEGSTAATALSLARRLPIVGHTCAVTQDPSPANIARLALDVATVIVFVQVVAHTLPEVTGVAVAMNHAPGVLAAAGVLLEHGPGIVASVRGGLDQIDRLNNLGDEMQARLRSGAQAQVTQPQDLPATVTTAPALAPEPVPAPALAQQAQAQQPAAAAKPATGSIFSNSAATIGLAGQAAWQGLSKAGQQAAAAAAQAGQGLAGTVQGICITMPVGHIGCSPQPATR
jgi:hypothetical protein